MKASMHMLISVILLSLTSHTKNSMDMSIRAQGIECPCILTPNTSLCGQLSDALAVDVHRDIVPSVYKKLNVL